MIDLEREKDILNTAKKDGYKEAMKKIEQAQKDAYNQAIDDVTENATVDIIDHEELHIDSLVPSDDVIKILPIYGVDMDSILKLKK
jgi:hypothetical protein